MKGKHKSWRKRHRLWRSQHPPSWDLPGSGLQSWRCGNSRCALNCGRRSMARSFEFTLAESPSTHKAGNQLDLIFTRNCASPNEQPA
ncbi:hypothetical protein AAFF_G00110230 [Aldrovandia affinis]|uniref:Uncharacterized protein n=1 Tax=Aldrovandia affinis TaxID=143900 RepID=A0AAD7WBS8_9TELE|nr:hypothetical protein AAFF_G00110230 [Aldrovandia affinis]